MSKFVKRSDVEDEQFEWGVIGWRCVPRTGARQIVVMDVSLEPGQGHDFHRHPGQEEMIIVKRGRITQYLERESTTLQAEDSVFIEADVVHASFNEGDETAHLQVVIAPSLGEGTGYGLVDVSGEEPWASVRNHA
ncbi:MAG: cupin domain-containing protein [Solirubrobacterales bacterium]|nr:cupin domain-containing protein [Solirubrobacterales bacterium]MBV9714958.1 cupin domain-containing protein [Solirubrobacterales bacterium]